MPETVQFKLPICPPWERNPIRIDNTMIEKSKNGATSTELLTTFKERNNNRYKFSKMIYTDGSKMVDRTGFSVISDQTIIKKRINGYSSIFHAESAAIIEALTWINQQNDINEYVICTDSLSAITNLQKKNKPKTSSKTRQMYYTTR